VKMGRLFSNMYCVLCIVLCVKRAGVYLVPREFPYDFFLWGYVKDLV
jgi:hypothetical protein